MTSRERLFLGLAVIGFVAPNAMVIAFVAEHGVDVGTYLGDWFGTLPAAQLAVDLLICCVAFLAWAAYEGPRVGARRWWWAIPATFLVGLCFAIPLFLYLRERALAGISGVTGSLTART